VRIDVEASHLASPGILPALPPALPGKDGGNPQIQFCKERLTCFAGRRRTYTMREEFNSNAFLAVTIASVFLLGSGLLALALS